MTKRQKRRNDKKTKRRNDKKTKRRNDKKTKGRKDERRQRFFFCPGPAFKNKDFSDSGVPKLILG